MALFLSRTPAQSFAPPTISERKQIQMKELGVGPLALKEVPPQLQLPDLRTELICRGINTRPDAKDSCTYLETKDGAVRALAVGERCPLIYRSEKYQFSNEETGLWIEPVAADDQQLVARVGMKDLRGEFSLKTQREKGEKWQLGELRVDSSLLARLRTRWFGEDLFLNHHGGSEYGRVLGKERIEFGEEGTSYRCFVGEGDLLVWKEGRWKEAEGETEGLPLMRIERVEAKSMHLQIWDGEGRRKTNLTLMRARDAWLPAQMQKMVRFCAAKTRSLFLLEVGDERIAVSPNDWMLLSKDGWRKLATVEEIDSYVNGELIGELLIFDRLKRSEGRQVLEGHLYNKTRSSVKSIELPLRAEQEAA